MRALSFMVFVLVATALIGLLHWYFWLRLVRDPGWPAGVSVGLTAAIVLVVLAVPPAFVFARQLPRETGRLLSWALYVWMGSVFFLFVALVLGDVARLLAATADAVLTALGKGAPADPARRELVARGIAGVAGAATVGLSAVAVRSARGEVETREVEVKLERLPKALSGLTLVQLTDVHVGPTIGKRFIESIVEKTHAARPDAVVITGDLVDGSVHELLEHVAPIAKLKARYGVYFVSGNHEYYSGYGAWREVLRKMGIRVLSNERVILGDAASIDLAGVDDWTSGRFAGAGPDLRRALADRDPEREVVLLAHQPKQVVEAAERGVGLQLSGHTHGGQIFPFGGVVSLVQPYLAGLHRHDDKTQIYVSRGTGYWGPPMRLLAPAEITKIVLT